MKIGLIMDLVTINHILKEMNLKKTDLIIGLKMDLAIDHLTMKVDLS